MIVKLYTTQGCHLCEQALTMLIELKVDLDIEEVEISANEKLLETYGLRIPVIALESRDAELNWPFDSTRLIQFLAGG
jgi:glutaredoxin